MKLTAFLSLLFALNTFFSPFLAGARAPVRSYVQEKTKTIKFTPVTPPSATITGQMAGPTAFIKVIDATVTPADSLKSVQFTITPKAGSVTRPISATYTANYLQSRGYLNTGTGSASIPVFGLYANSSNTVVLNFIFTDGSSQQNIVPVATVDWTDSCNQYKTPIVLQGRTASTSLSYDFFIIKNSCGTQSPIIMDTDGQVRWIGPTGFSSFVSMLFANGIYISIPPPAGTKQTGLYRIDFDGILTFLHDFQTDGASQTHHNADPGREGMLFEFDTSTNTECIVVEANTAGTILRTWNFADIISAAITAGGGTPSQFVTNGVDWFHMNAATYRKSDNTLIVSSRENFVIAVDYDSKAIKWILGDPTKQWYQFQGLKQYALTVDPNSLPPIGQHAVSITHDDNLLLFDDGYSSLHHTPKGADRTYSAPRKYHIDTQAMPPSATELWNYPHGQTLYSPICSSIYEDDPLNYLVDYSNITVPNGPLTPSTNQVLGLDNAGNQVFNYGWSNPNNGGCNGGWNSIPIHLEQMTFTSVVPLRAVSRKTHLNGAGTYDIDLPLSGKPGLECRTGDYQVVVTFATTPVSVSSASVTSDSGGTATAGTPTISGKDVTVNLTGVSTAQTLTIKLAGVSDGTNTDDVSIRMSVLVGDVDGSGHVDGNDVSGVQSHTRQITASNNYRFDVDATGRIDGNDVSATQAHTRTGLPSPP